MGLLEQSAAHVRRVLENTALFAQPITVTDPLGHTATVNGQTVGVSSDIDPNTGQFVVSDKAGVAFSMATLTAAGFTEMPRSIVETSRRPWVIRFTDARGNARVFKVRKAEPDSSN